jgi:dTDP-4-dehydrorhamnose reductase
VVRLYAFGTEGQVARSLRRAAINDPGLVIGFGGRPEVDICRGDLVEKALLGFSPDIVINPAAYTAVDRAESEADLAFSINRDGAEVVAAAADRLGLPVIHLSTDYVFDGTKNAPYVESDVPNPRSVYGRSKLEGERAVAKANPRHIILRTSWVYSPYGTNFVRTMLRLAATHATLRVVDDQIGCPTYAPDIAIAIFAIARRIHCSGWSDELAGVTHIAGPDQLTWFAFAQKIMRLWAERGRASVPVAPIASKDYPTAAVRPANSRLDCQRLSAIFDIQMPPMARSLGDCLELLWEAEDRSRRSA